MEKFSASSYKEDQRIELVNSQDLDKLYAAIEAEENFILQWNEGNVKKSEVIIATNIASKVKTGEMKLTAQEQGGNKK